MNKQEFNTEELEYIEGWQKASLPEIRHRCHRITTSLIHNLTWLSIHAEDTFERILLVIEQYDASLRDKILHEIMCNIAGV